VANLEQMATLGATLTKIDGDLASVQPVERLRVRSDRCSGRLASTVLDFGGHLATEDGRYFVVWASNGSTGPSSTLDLGLPTDGMTLPWQNDQFETVGATQP
jgi:hypothetical protein